MDVREDVDAVFGKPFVDEVFAKKEVQWPVLNGLDFDRAWSQLGRQFKKKSPHTCPLHKHLVVVWFLILLD